MPYGNSRYASANYIKATNPSKENMVQHYDSHEFSIPSNQAIYIPFINTQPRDTQDDVQDDVKNTDKILGSSVEVGSRVNFLYMRQRITPTVITPQEFSTAVLSIAGDYLDKFLAQMDNELDYLHSSLHTKTERDLYGDIKLFEAESLKDFVQVPPLFTPAESPKRDFFSIGQNYQGFNNFRTHEMYGWVPVEQQGSIEVPRQYKRIAPRTVWWQFIWNRSQSPINIEYFKSFKEYKEE